MVGAPKAATTSIHYYLNQHPDFYLSANKEPHFFCTDFKEDNKRIGLKQFPIEFEEEKYLSFFKDGEGKKIVGDASTSNLYSDNSAEEIFKFNPNAKILIILREPSSLMFSWYNYLKYYSQETANSFEEALALEEERRHDKSIPPTVFFKQFLYYRKIVQFDNHIAKYIKLFGQDNVQVLLFDDVKKDLRLELKKICQFLNVDDSFSFELETVKNSAKSVKNQKLKLFVDKNLFWLQRKLLPLRDTYLLKKLHGLYEHMFLSESKNETLSQETQRALKVELTPIVERTGNLINKNLKEIWGYNE